MKRRFARRRIGNAALWGVAIFALVAWTRWLDASLARSGYATGYLLYAAVVFLAAYNLRKKLPGLPLGSSRSWMQAHAWVGIATGALFLMHLAAQGPIGWPDGWLEFSLAAIFTSTFASGLLGLYLTRTLPRKLARTGEQFVFERIPRLRARVRGEARAVTLGAVHATGATTLADYYADRLHGFFSRPRSVVYWWRPSTATRKRLFAELTDIQRLLSDKELAASERLFKLVRRKDDLDFHASRQGLLKGWIVIHAALTWGLLILGATHGLLAVAMRGGPS